MSFVAGPVSVGETPTYKVDYKLGININYEVSLEAIAPYVGNKLKPIPVRMVETDTESKYLVSLYLAFCGMNDASDGNWGNRADVFTYIEDENGDVGMLFLAVLVDVPELVPKADIPKFMRFNEKFFLDSETGKCSVAHQMIDKMTLAHSGIDMQMGKCSFKSTFKSKNTTLFHREFVLTNSQIYQNSHDKTTNYFNQEFMRAPVEDIDLSSVQQVFPEQIHPLCNMNNLYSVQKYGNTSKPICWYFKPPPLSGLKIARQSKSKL